MNWPADMYQMHKDTVDNELPLKYRIAEELYSQCVTLSGDADAIIWQKITTGHQK